MKKFKWQVNKGKQMFKNINEKIYQGHKTFCKFDLTLGVNEYRYVVFWGTKAELLAITSPKQLFAEYKFFSKVNVFDGKTYINYVLALPKAKK